MAGSYLIGLAVGSVWLWHDTEYVFHAGIMLVGCFLLFRKTWLRMLCLLIGVLFIGFWWSQYNLHQMMITEPFVYEGLVRIVSVKYASAPRQRVMAKLLEGNHAGKQVSILTYDWQRDAGETVRLRMAVAPSSQTYDRGRGVVGVSTAVEAVEFVGPVRGIDVLRAKLALGVQQTLPEPQASLAIGLVTGMSDAFDEQFKEDLRRTGTTHIVAVSGANLTIVAALVQRSLRKRGRLVALLVAMGTVLFYVFLAGAGAAVLRGAMMSSLYLYARYLGRVTHRAPLLLATAVGLSVIMPLGMVYSLSWQLSFLAFAGIIFISPLITPWFARWGGSLGAALGETVSAQVVVLPLIVTQFQTLSIVAPFVNAVILLLTPLAMGLSALHAFVSLVSLPLAGYLAWITHALLFLLVEPIVWASQLQFAAVEVGAFSSVMMAGSYVTLVLGFVWLTRYVQRRQYAQSL